MNCMIRINAQVKEKIFRGRVRCDPGMCRSYQQMIGTVRGVIDNLTNAAPKDLKWERRHASDSIRGKCNGCRWETEAADAIIAIVTLIRAEESHIIGFRELMERPEHVVPTCKYCPGLQIVIDRMGLNIRVFISKHPDMSPEGMGSNDATLELNSLARFTTKTCGCDTVGRLEKALEDAVLAYSGRLIGKADKDGPPGRRTVDPNVLPFEETPAYRAMRAREDSIVHKILSIGKKYATDAAIMQAGEFLAKCKKVLPGFGLDILSEPDGNRIAPPAAAFATLDALAKKWDGDCDQCGTNMGGVFTIEGFMLAERLAAVLRAVEIIGATRSYGRAEKIAAASRLLEKIGRDSGFDSAAGIVRKIEEK